MRTIKITPSITTREELSMDKYLNEIGKYKVLEPDEEKALFVLAKNGDRKAFETVIRANLRFVVSVAKQYQSGKHGLSLMDLINIGNEGLVKAGYRFDETKGFKFISYAVRWIRQKILHEIGRVGSNVFRAGIRDKASTPVQNLYEDLTHELGRFPTPEEIKEIYDEEYGTDISIDLVIHIIFGHQKATSLDSPLNSSPDSDSRHEVLPSFDEQYGYFEDQAIKVELVNVLKSQLTPRERNILKYYFGIGVSKSHTLDEIAEIEELSRERVRQIKNSTLERLRETIGNSSAQYAEQLREFFQ